MDTYLWKRLKGLYLLLVFTLLLLLPSGSAYGATSYRIQGDLPKYPASDFKEEERACALATVKIVASTKDAFTATGSESYWAEFRLPRNFYITSAGIYGDDQQDVELARGRGFEGQARAVEIKPIAEERNKPGYYRGFEIMVENIERPDDYPELQLYFNRVVVPRGYKGNVELSIDSAGAGFSSGSLTIANIMSARLTVEASEVQFLVGSEQALGPIRVTENMPGTFDYIEMTLPGGYQWNQDSCYIDPMLGFRHDFNGDGRYDKDDFMISVEGDKYGQSILHIEALGKTKTVGKMEIECKVQFKEEHSSYGDLNLQLKSNAELNVSSLKVASYSQQKIDLSVQNLKDVYGGLCAQKIGNIIISENAPTTLAINRRVTLSLPEGAKWAVLPSIQLEGDNYLDTGALVLNAEKDQISFEIEDCSRDRPGKIVLEEGKVDLATDFQGELLVEVDGTAGASGTITIAQVKPAFTAIASSKPSLLVGKQEQLAGDLEITESAGRVLLARELWIEFPAGIKLARNPQVEVAAGDIRLSSSLLNQEGDRERLVIPIQNSSSKPAKILVKGIAYNLNNMLPDGDIKIKLGGPAANEVNSGSNLIFPNRNWVCEVANASISKDNPNSIKKVSTSSNSITETIVFRIGEKSYKLNGQDTPMDVEPYILDGRTFIPLRYIALATGIKPENILWDEATARVTLYSQDNIIQLKIGDKAIYRNGNLLSMDAAAHIKEGRTMVPLRALAEALGRTVNWDAASYSVTLK